MSKVNKQAYMFIGTLNNPDPTVCEDYLRKWHTEHDARYATG